MAEDKKKELPKDYVCPECGSDRVELRKSGFVQCSECDFLDRSLVK